MPLTNLRTYRIIGTDSEKVKEALAKYAKSNGNSNFYDVEGIGAVISRWQSEWRLSIASASPNHNEARATIEEIIGFPLGNIYKGLALPQKQKIPRETNIGKMIRKPNILNHSSLGGFG